MLCRVRRELQARLLPVAAKEADDVDDAGDALHPDDAVDPDYAVHPDDAVDYDDADRSANTFVDLLCFA